MHRVFGDMMAEKGCGSIINIGSYMGFLGPDDTLYRGVSFSGFNSPDYFFHKGGMTNLTRFMASKYGPQGVRVNVLELGGLLRDQDEIFVERYNDRTFVKRMANDTDIMGIIILLASDASSYITGAVIPVDGGYSAK
jgi:NAD(P)-dependent dehydrogenase (short-subunit alcohol dehydrogenase family)